MGVRNTHANTMKSRNKTNILLLLAAAIAALMSTACGTVRGFGRDVENVGENIEQSAR